MLWLFAANKVVYIYIILSWVTAADKIKCEYTADHQSCNPRMETSPHNVAEHSELWGRALTLAALTGRPIDRLLK